MIAALLSMPIGLDAARLPVGLQLASYHGRDADFIRLAIACERALGVCADRLGDLRFSMPYPANGRRDVDVRRPVAAASDGCFVREFISFACVPWPHMCSPLHVV